MTSVVGPFLSSCIGLRLSAYFPLGTSDSRQATDCRQTTSPEPWSAPQFHGHHE
jgi:hypothetical protein